MANRLTLKTLGSVVAMATLFVVMLGSLYLLSTMAERLDRFGHYYHGLLVFNGLALLALTWLIVYNAVRLFREFRAQIAGSRLTLRMVVICILLTLVPVLIVYSFSVKFLNSNIDSWYDVEIEQALDDALQLSRESLGLQMRTLQRTTIEAAEHLIGVSDEEAILVLNEFGINTEASEMTLIGPDNRVIASTGSTTRLSVSPNRPDDDLSSRARRGLTYVGIDPIGDSEIYIRVVTPVFSDSATRENSVLQALYPVAERSSDLAESVQSSYQAYRQLVFLRNPLKTSSILTLSLALLLSVLIGVWFAFYAARRMMMPVHDLVEGTRAVAEGDYTRRVYKRGQDELGFLVQSFNYMTMQLDRSRQTEEKSRHELEQQRTYLEAVLGQISSAVVTLDGNHHIRTGNEAAKEILGLTFEDYEGKSLQQAVQAGGVLGQVAERLADSVSQISQAHGADSDNSVLATDSSWSNEIEVHSTNGKLVLFCRGAALTDSNRQYTGQVIAIDDMTAMISAQREAAWGEVARRLAHEIKNPLTPIRLSAERLRHKVISKLDPDDGEVVNRLTQTIENQVDAMKQMVNAFAAYASAPKLDLEAVDINALLAEVALLYDDENIELALDLDEDLPTLSLDAPRIRQLMHNLIRNSLEAQHASALPYVCLKTILVQKPGGALVELTTTDRGPGFATDLMGRLFEPYVTSKPKGTGLGLSIVKKIVEEHGGTVMAENRSHKAEENATTGQMLGATIRVSLPIASDTLSKPVRLGVDAA